jgi:polyether ionophore transport system permease protein
MMSAASEAPAARSAGRPSPHPALDAGLALARRAFLDARVRTICFACLFAIYAYIQPVGYRNAYPTISDRVQFARSFSANKAIRLFYGQPHDLLGVSGYAAWRVGGTLAILAAVYGLLAAVRALRSEEDAGHQELVLSGILGRTAAYLAALAAIAAGLILLWLGESLGFIAAGLPAGGSAYLALATASVVGVCAGVGALACQLASTRRMALELGGGIVGLWLLLRVIADTAGGAGWLRWTTPLGWAEELRPFAGPRPLVLVLPLLASTLLLALAGAIARGRDVGTGTLPARDSAEPRLRLLSSPAALALRIERSTLLVWLGCIGAFAYILGVIARSSSSAGISPSLRRELAKLGSGSIATPAGYLGFTFIFFALALSLFSCAQVGAARHEEAEQRLETLLAQPLGRRGWLAGRVGLTACAAAVLALTAGLLSWAGANSGGADVPFGKMLEAGANCLPVALLFLGIAALAYAACPRASAAIAYGLLTACFLWDLVGSLLSAPRWLVKLTPFAHIGAVPAQPFHAGAAAIMVALGAAASLCATWVFRRRDLTGA